MKKTLLYSLAAMASITLASCTGDYTDWASPQTNVQEAAANKYGVTFAAGPESNGSMADEDGIINLVTISSTDANVSGYTLTDFKVNGVSVDATISGNTVQVAAVTLENLVCNQHSSRASIARDLTVETQVSVNLASGDAVAISTKGETTGTFTPAATPAVDEKGYYMLGDINGNAWDATAPVWMKKVSDGVYQAKVTTTKDDSNWYKFYEGNHFESGNWDSINAGALGCQENGSTDFQGFVIWTGDSWGEVQTPVISGAGTWIVTLDMNNLTYAVAKPVLYLAGNCNGWNQIDYLAGEDGVNFTGFMYLDQNGFKFCSQQDWNGTNYGEDFSTDGNAGNITMKEDVGYYKVDVDLDNKSYTLTPITTIGIIGDATADGWNSDQDMTYNLTDRCWEIKDVTLSTGSFKFRANDSWDINWGGTEDTLTQNGNNIDVAAGTYDIKLYAWCDGYAYCTITKK